MLSPCQSTTSVGGDWRKRLLDDSGVPACEKHAAQTHKGKTFWNATLVAYVQTAVEEKGSSDKPWERE